MFFNWKINVVKITILPKSFYGINAIPIKLTVAFFTELEQNILKCVWKQNRCGIAKGILTRENET